MNDSGQDRSNAARFGDLVLGRDARTVSVRGERVELTRREFDLFDLLASNPDRVFTRDELLRSVWHSKAEWQSTKTITEHIRRLRNKLGPDEDAAFRIVTVIGVGYRFESLDVAERPNVDPSSRAEATQCFLIVDGALIVDASPAAVELLGAESADGLVGHQLPEFIAARSMPAAVQRIESRALDESPRPETLWLRRVDGTELPAQVSSTAVTFDGWAHHQTTLWPLADNIRTHLHRVALGVTSEVSDAVIILDPSYRVQTLNDAAEHLYGWTEVEASDTPPALIPWAADNADLEGIEEILLRDGHWHGDVEQVRRDGDTIHVHVSAAMMGEEVAHPAGVVLVSRTARTTPLDAEAADLSEEVGPAIDAGVFHPHYQPIVNMETRRVIGVEALARWHHPSRGVLLPTTFLETAERTGDIVRLGRQLLIEACNQAVAWRHAGHDIDLAFNVSAQQLLGGTLVDDVTATLATAELAPQQLLIEITETELIVDVTRAAQLLRELTDRGVRVAIDDFGTGWASLTYLTRLPVHALKIDRMFTLGVHDNPSDIAVARSIISLGNELDLLVIAEGIETVEQETAMTELGCWIGQGYLYAQPLPASDVVLSIDT
ncbi:MAG: EAL domain-containing protein [Ilumatobacteraceae bacterium]